MREKLLLMMVDFQEKFHCNTDFVMRKAHFIMTRQANDLASKMFLKSIKVFGRRTSINLTASNPEFTQFFSEDEQQERKLIG